MMPEGEEIQTCPNVIVYDIVALALAAATIHKKRRIMMRMVNFNRGAH
jgi:hypothetical protein